MLEAEVNKSIPSCQLFQHIIIASVLWLCDAKDLKIVMRCDSSWAAAAVNKKLMMRCSEAETTTNKVAAASDSEEGRASSRDGKSPLEGRQPYWSVVFISEEYMYS